MALNSCDENKQSVTSMVCLLCRRERFGKKTIYQNIISWLHVYVFEIQSTTILAS